MVSKTEKLCFKVDGLGMTDLVRQMYLYEDKQKAWNIMESFPGLTIEQAKELFLGNAQFENIKDSNSLNYVIKENKKWKDEYSKHTEFLKEQELEKLKEDKDRFYALELMDDITSLEMYDAIDYIRLARKQNSSKNLVQTAKDIIKKQKMVELNMSDTQRQMIYGDEEEISGSADEMLEELQKKANLDIAKQMFCMNFSEKDPEMKKASNELIKSFANKEYSFVFKGHNYTYNDSARNQGRCPHCDAKSKNYIWDKKDEGYLGYHDFGGNQVAVCFECPECFENFYYHYDKNNFVEDDE